jgi:hypothetical protein
MAQPVCSATCYVLCLWVGPSSPAGGHVVPGRAGTVPLVCSSRAGVYRAWYWCCLLRLPVASVWLREACWLPAESADFLSTTANGTGLLRPPFLPGGCTLCVLSGVRLLLLQLRAMASAAVPPGERASRRRLLLLRVQWVLCCLGIRLCSCGRRAHGLDAGYRPIASCRSVRPLLLRSGILCPCQIRRD